MYVDHLWPTIDSVHPSNLGIQSKRDLVHVCVERTLASLLRDYGSSCCPARARQWGADGVVVSAKSKEMIRSVRRWVGKDCLIFSPGVGAQGGTGSAALVAGADFVIVGRSVMEASEPSRAVSELLNQLVRA